MKNKGWVMIGVLIWEYLFVMITTSLGVTTGGGDLISITTDPTFFQIVGGFFKTFIGLLTFSAEGLPIIIIFFAVYLPLILLLTAIAFFVRGD